MGADQAPRTAHDGDVPAPEGWKHERRRAAPRRRPPGPGAGPGADAVGAVDGASSLATTRALARRASRLDGTSAAFVRPARRVVVHRQERRGDARRYKVTACAVAQTRDLPARHRDEHERTRLRRPSGLLDSLAQQGGRELQLRHRNPPQAAPGPPRRPVTADQDAPARPTSPPPAWPARPPPACRRHGPPGVLAVASRRRPPRRAAAHPHLRADPRCSPPSRGGRALDRRVGCDLARWPHRVAATDAARGHTATSILELAAGAPWGVGADWAAFAATSQQWQ
ncbi:hypothetical protein QJS66_11320 [Kocuria rhizophila]|nr:hypothetical protein QJS66_11320 [Kocuria rhizophila]